MRKTKRPSSRKSWLRRIEQAKYLPQPSSARTLTLMLRWLKRACCTMTAIATMYATWRLPSLHFESLSGGTLPKTLQSTESATSHLHVLAQSQSSSFPHILPSIPPRRGLPCRWQREALSHPFCTSALLQTSPAPTPSRRPRMTSFGNHRESLLDNPHFTRLWSTIRGGALSFRLTS